MNAYKNKIRIQNAITYAIVIGCYILIQIMMAGGHVNSLLKGILVPLCTYTILAVSLNLTVGILGELSLGHAGFMCAGAFSGAFFNHAMKNVIASNQVRFILALFVGAAVAAVFGILIGIPVLRLKGDYLAIVTLAFGEIVKNIINVLYVGIDGNGIHVSMKDVASLKLAADGELIALTEQLLQRLLGQVNVTGRRFDHKRHGFFLLIVEHWSTMKIVPQHAPYNDASKQDTDATQHRHRPLHAPDGPGKAHAPPHRHKDGPHPAHAGDDPQQAENTQHQRLVQVEAAGLPVPRQHGDEQTDPCAVADDICGALIHRSHPFPYAIWHCSTFSPVFQETGRYKFPCNPVKICYNDSILHQ